MTVETLFLACFAFGALFTLASVLLGVAGHAAGGHAGHLPHGGHDALAPQALHSPPDLNASAMPAAHAMHAPTPAMGQAGELGQAPGSSTPLLWLAHLPLLNATPVLAFVTWLGAAGYLLLRVTAWPLLAVSAVALASGLVAALLMAAFLQKVLSGERVMDPREYRLEGTLARVTVGIPAGGTGEIVFTKAGRRRSEAARSLDGRPIARGTEVVIMRYARGIASVQPWEALLASTTASTSAAPPFGQGT
jgi:membrane protein implicated in regulation of membrane protease activity